MNLVELLQKGCEGKKAAFESVDLRKKRKAARDAAAKAYYEIPNPDLAQVTTWEKLKPLSITRAKVLNKVDSFIRDPESIPEHFRNTPAMVGYLEAHKVYSAPFAEYQTALAKALGVKPGLLDFDHEDKDLTLWTSPGVGVGIGISAEELNPEGLRQYANEPAFDNPTFKKLVNLDSPAAPNIASSELLRAEAKTLETPSSQLPSNIPSASREVVREAVAADAGEAARTAASAPKRLGFAAGTMGRIKTNFGAAIPASHKVWRSLGAATGGGLAAVEAYNAFNAYEPDPNSGEKKRSWTKTVTHGALAAASAVGGVAALAVTKGRVP
jgi:hypothetical protein